MVDFPAWAGCDEKIEETGNDQVPSDAILLARTMPVAGRETPRLTHVFPARIEPSGYMTAYCGLRTRTESMELLHRLAGVPCEKCLLLVMSRRGRAVHPAGRPGHRTR